jgi:ABC-type amino acid transport substrate-binding protein
LAAINKGLEEVIMDGTYAEIYRKYLGDDPIKEFQKGNTGVKPGN